MTLTEHKLHQSETSLITLIEENPINQISNIKSNKLSEPIFQYALQASNAFKSAGLGTWSFDFETNTLKICDRCKILIGITQEDVSDIGLLMDRCPEENFPEIIHAFKVARDKGKPFDIQLHAANKSEFNDQRWIRLTGIPAPGRNNGLPKLYGTIGDISAKVNRDTDRQDMMSIFNHEMKSPLTSIKLYVQLCRSIVDSNINPAIIRYLENADKMVDNAANLLDYFLKGPTMETGRLILSKADFNVHELITDIAEDIKILYPEHQLILRNIIHLTIRADRERLGQVIRNLLSNAIKYSPNPDIIIISCKIVRNNLQVSIKDQGIGIPAQEHSRIFEKFYRVPNNLENAIPGYGIGLYLCKHIINEHNGRIWFMSNKTGGSTFYFSLPVF